jgi:hypothetical protein
MKNLIALVIVFMVAGCASNGVLTFNTYPDLKKEQRIQWQWMIGKWYGKQPLSYGGEHEWLRENFPNGTYKIQFKSSNPDGSLIEKTEFGIWGLSGDVYFSIYQGHLEGENISESDPSDPEIYDAYHIIHLSEKAMEYMHARTKAKFKVKKVPVIFTLKGKSL